MVVGHCKTCGEEIRSRRSDKNSAQANFLGAVRRHYRKKHKNTLGLRISRGLRSSGNNPSMQDMTTALLDGPRAALGVYKKYTEKQYQQMKKVLDAIEPILPDNMRFAWKFIEALHDEGIKPK